MSKAPDNKFAYTADVRTIAKHLQAQFHPVPPSSIQVKLLGSGSDSRVFEVYVHQCIYLYKIKHGQVFSNHVISGSPQQDEHTHVSPTPSPPPRLRKLIVWADVLPLDLRKRIKAMAGDYSAEIARLETDGRFRTATWNTALAYGYAAWYVLRGPLDGVIGLLVKSFKGH